jgi:hypothetical protein
LCGRFFKAPQPAMYVLYEPAAVHSPVPTVLPQVCLSPLSQFFCNVSNPPDIYANMTLDGYCSVEQLGHLARRGAGQL